MQPNRRTLCGSYGRFGARFLGHYHRAVFLRGYLLGIAGTGMLAPQQTKFDETKLTFRARV